MNSHSKSLTTFRIPIIAQQVTHARWPREFYDTYCKAKTKNKGYVVLGQGSNVLFTSEFDGYIVINQYKGIRIEVATNDFMVYANSGVTINELIDYLHRYKVYGLENLSSIPSSVGAACISNIGAYGVEFEQFVDHIILLDLTTGQQETIVKTDCQFSYRNSIFKTPSYQNRYVVLTVCLRIPKLYHPVLTYAPLNTLNPEMTNAQEIRQLVDKVRAEKLPDYELTGNGGSFFMNPIVTTEFYQQLVTRFPNIVSYKVDSSSVKLSAGWLIEHAGLKGYLHKNAQVSPKHALVLVNSNQEATGTEIAELAAYVVTSVQAKFGVTLVPEIRFMGTSGEINATDYLQSIINVA